MARVALAVVAVLAIAWSAVLLRDQKVGDDASRAVYQAIKAPRPKFDAELERLEDAQFLNPDSTWDFLRANYLLSRDPPAAQKALEDIVASEPENLQAWAGLYVARERTGSPDAAEALAKVRELDPLTSKLSTRRPASP